MPHNDSQCLKNASIFVTSHGQTLIYLFQTENSASFECVMPHFRQNLRNFKNRGSLLPYDQLHSILIRNFEKKIFFEILRNRSHI